MTSTPLAPAVDAGPAEALRLQSVVKTYGSGASPRHRPPRREPRHREGDLHRDHGPLRLGQEHAAAQCRGTRPAQQRHRPPRGNRDLEASRRVSSPPSGATTWASCSRRYNLLPALNVEDNITLPLRLGGRSLEARWLDFLLDAVGLAEFPSPPPLRALRWPAAAGGDRARPHHPTARGVRRRADRRARLALGQAGARPARAHGAGAEPDRRGRDARPRRGIARRSRDLPRRRRLRGIPRRRRTPRRSTTA